MAQPSVQFYVSSRTGALLRRREEDGDWIFAADTGVWYQPTDAILKYMIGDDMDIDEVTAEQAQADYPDAFA